MKKNNATPIGLRIREAREYRKYTTEHLAELLSSTHKISKQAISQYENGYVTPPPQRVAEIANKLGFPLNYFTKSWETVDQHSPTQFRKIAAATKKHRNQAELKADWFVRFIHCLGNHVSIKKHSLIRYDVGVDAIHENELEAVAQNLRAQWGLGNAPIDNLLLVLEENGVIIGESNIHDSLEAFSFWNAEVPFIFMSNENKNYFRSRLSVAHELGHLILHRHVTAEMIQNRETHRLLEKQAFYFGAAFLLPRESFGEEVMRYEESYWTELKRRWGVSIAAMVLRAANIGKITEAQKAYFFRQRGRSKDEPADNEEEQEKPNLVKALIRELNTEKKVPLSVILDEVGITEEMLQQIIKIKDAN